MDQYTAYDRVTDVVLHGVIGQPICKTKNVVHYEDNGCFLADLAIIVPLGLERHLSAYEDNRGQTSHSQGHELENESFWEQDDAHRDQKSSVSEEQRVIDIFVVLLVKTLICAQILFLEFFLTEPLAIVV